MGFRAPTATIDGLRKRTASNFSVVEDSTPIDPSDTSGGTAQSTIEIRETDQAKYLRKKQITLEDGAQGTTVGKITGLSANGVSLSITADSRLNVLNVKRLAQPFAGTLKAAVTYYLGLCGVTTGLVIDDSLEAVDVVFPGWDAVVWDQLKKLCPIFRIEIGLVSNNVVVRPVRQRVAVNSRDADVSWSLDDSQIAQTVEIFYYQNEQRTNDVIYPLGRKIDDIQSFGGLEAGSTTTSNVSLNPSNGSEGLGVSLSAIGQPTCVDSVDEDDYSASVYTVTGKDQSVIDPDAWVAGGGNISVAIGEDTRSIDITITASVDTSNAPYSISMPVGENDSFPSLRLLGSGVFFDKKMVTLHTGNSADDAPEVVGASVDDEFISTRDQAVDSGIWTLAAATGPKQQLQVSTKGINRRSDNGSYAYPTIADFNVQYAGKTLAEFNAPYVGKTLADYNADQFALSAADFSNQAFGNIAGARVFNDGCWYRIRTATITPIGISYTAERDTTLADWNNWYAGKTLAEVNALLAGLTLGEHAVRPLLKPPRQTIPASGGIPYPDDFYPDQLYPAAEDDEMFVSSFPGEGYPDGTYPA